MVLKVKMYTIISRLRWIRWQSEDRSRMRDIKIIIWSIVSFSIVMRSAEESSCPIDIFLIGDGSTPIDINDTKKMMIIAGLKLMYSDESIIISIEIVFVCGEGPVGSISI